MQLPSFPSFSFLSFPSFETASSGSGVIQCLRVRRYKCEP
jgi:hypothetical protein